MQFLATNLVQMRDNSINNAPALLSAIGSAATPKIRRSYIMILTEDVLQRYRANQGYVYLIHAVGTDRYKIGRSVNPPVRLEQLKGQSPYPLQILDSFWSPDIFADEAGIHKDFAKYRIYGEWFKLVDAEIQGPQPLEFLENTFTFDRPVATALANDTWNCLLRKILVNNGETSLGELVDKSRSFWDEASKKMGPAGHWSKEDLDTWFTSYNEDKLTCLHSSSSLNFLYHSATSVNALKAIDYFAKECLIAGVQNYWEVSERNIPDEMIVSIEASIKSFETFILGYQNNLVGEIGL